MDDKDTESQELETRLRVLEFFHIYRGGTAHCLPASLVTRQPTPGAMRMVWNVAVSMAGFRPPLEPAPTRPFNLYPGDVTQPAVPVTSAHPKGIRRCLIKLVKRGKVEWVKSNPAKPYTIRRRRGEFVNVGIQSRWTASR